MLGKLLVFAAIGVALWLMLRPKKAAPKKRLEAEDFTRCPDCGAWRRAGEPCDCGKE